MQIPSLTDPEFDELLRIGIAAREGILASADIRLPHTPEHDPGLSQALLFIKPEALAPEVNVSAVISLVLNHAHEKDLDVGGVAVLGWTMMASGLMAAHYSVINKLSTIGAPALTTTALEAISPLTENGKIEILGAHQLIDRFGLTSAEVLRLAESSGIQKIAQGTYVARLEYPCQCIVINAFHPAQLEHFTEPGAMVIAFDVTFRYSWSEFRDKTLGATDPQKAQPGSLRRKLLDAAKDLNIRQVSQNRNCIHGSGGPIEGMTEISRFFRTDLSRTQYGAQMLSSGFDMEKLRWAAANPTLGSGSSLFEATECAAPDEALQILKNYLRSNRDDPSRLSNPVRPLSSAPSPIRSAQGSVSSHTADAPASFRFPGDRILSVQSSQGMYAQSASVIHLLPHASRDRRSRFQPLWTRMERRGSISVWPPTIALLRPSSTRASKSCEMAAVSLV
jgi:Nucleoside diphosphate kinase